MLENRNSGLGNPSSQSRETVCIDTYRVLDSCRDRDCYEDKRVYLTAVGQEIIDGNCSVRARDARILSTFVGVDPVLFNRGFYRVTARTYLQLTLEACSGTGTGRSQEFCGLVVFEKSVILYGGEGEITSYRSTPGGSVCDAASCAASTSLPIGVVETAPPIVLSVDVKGAPCGCAGGCGCGCDDNGVASCNAPPTCNVDIPESILECFDGPFVDPTQNYLYASIGVFSVVRIERPTQILVSASDYSVPDKECLSQSSDDPCGTFRNMPFPNDAFSIGDAVPIRRESGNEGNSCGCRK